MISAKRRYGGKFPLRRLTPFSRAHRELRISQAAGLVFTCGEGVLIWMSVVVDLAADVGPEFFGYVAECVQEDVGAPDGHGVAEGALVVGMVGV